MMRSLTWKIAGGLAVVFVAVLTLARPADAAHLRVAFNPTVQATAGQPVQLQARVTSDAGDAVSGATVTFTTRESFDGVSGAAEIARAVTNNDGVATASYTPRDAGNEDITVDYAAPGDSTPEQGTMTLAVAPAAPGQLYQQQAGLRVPGLNAWLIIAVASLIWAILFGVAVTVVRIARAGSAPEEAPGAVLATVREREPVEAYGRQA